MNKKPMIIVGVLFGIIIIGLIVYLVLSLTTDIFKPASEMFNTYFKQDISQINKITDFSKEQEYVKTLTQENYRDNTNINFEYTNSKGIKEKFNIKSSGIVNNSENNSYKTIGIKYDDNLEIMNLEYLKENNTYGILFSNVVKQFISANINDLTDVLDIFGIDKTIVEKYDLLEILDIIINKKQSIENTCITYIKNVKENRFNKKKNVKFSLNNGEDKTGNEYTLTLYKDETKALYLEILKELGKQKEINEINETKRQFSETQISIFVVDNKTIRITGEIENKQVKIDFIDNELDIKYNDINTEEIKTFKIGIKKEEQNTSIKYSDSYNNIINLEYSLGEEISTKNAKISVDFQNDYIKQSNVALAQDIEISNSKIDGISKNFENQLNVNISNLKLTDKNIALNGLLKRIDSLLIKKNNQFNSELINAWINYNSVVEEKYEGLKEKQKRIFNNQFLSYKGQDVEKQLIYNLLELAGRNMKEYKTVGEDSFNIFITEGIQNTKDIEELKTQIEKSDKKFNIDFGYDSEGKINLIKIQGYDER